MASWELAAAGLVALACGACFTDEGAGTGTTTTEVAPATSTSDGSTQTGQTTRPGGETGTTATSGDPAGSESGVDPTTGATSEPGPLCPAAADFPGLGPDPACAACLGAQCCASVSECAGAAACAGAWSCVTAETCINDWAACPGYADSQATIGAISECIAGPCAAVCTAGVCAAQRAACTANPACGAVGDCVAASCQDLMCPPEDPNCYLACWDACAQQNPGGGEDWSALLYCYGVQCRA